jgi:hypothetical protein
VGLAEEEVEEGWYEEVQSGYQPVVGYPPL